MASPEIYRIHHCRKKGEYLMAKQGDREFFVTTARLPNHYRLMPKDEHGHARTDRAIGLQAQN